MATNYADGPQPGENGTPLRTEVQPNGGRRHFMADGRVVQEDGPGFRLEYQSLFPGKTYFRDIGVLGLADEAHLFEAWCYTSNALRKFAFFKVVSFEEIATGQRLTGEELRVLMGGTKLEGRNG